MTIFVKCALLIKLRVLLRYSVHGNNEDRTSTPFTPFLSNPLNEMGMSVDDKLYT